MHSTISRLNAFSTPCLLLIMVLAVTISVLSYLQRLDPEIQIEVHSIDHLKRSRQGTGEQALLQFRVNADFRPVWNWNVKDIYVAIVASYNTTGAMSPNRMKAMSVDDHDGGMGSADLLQQGNKVVLWDAIWSRKDEAYLSLNQIISAKYLLKHPKVELRGKQLELRLIYNVFPYIGTLTLYEHGSSGQAAYVQLPQEYS